MLDPVPDTALGHGRGYPRKAGHSAFHISLLFKKMTYVKGGVTEKVEKTKTFQATGTLPK